MAGHLLFSCPSLSRQASPHSASWPPTTCAIAPSWDPPKCLAPETSAPLKDTLLGHLQGSLGGRRWESITFIHPGLVELTCPVSNFLINATLWDGFHSAEEEECTERSRHLPLHQALLRTLVIAFSQGTVPSQKRGLGDLLVLWGLEESHYAQRLWSVSQRHERMEMLGLGDLLVGWEAPGSTLMLESFGLHVPRGPRRTWDSWDLLLLIASSWESSEWTLQSSQGLWCWRLAPEVLPAVVLWQGGAVLGYWFPESSYIALSLCCRIL